MIENKIFKIILATIFISNFIFNSFASDEIIIRGKGGTIKSKSGGIIKIKAGFNMMKIEKFKETFKSYSRV